MSLTHHGLDGIDVHIGLTSGTLMPPEGSEGLFSQRDVDVGSGANEHGNQ